MNALGWYASVSTSWPFVVAGSTSSVILTAADACCQIFIQPADSYDYRRTLGLAVFGATYYGGPCKLVYLGLDKFLGPTPQNVVAKTFLDVCVHTPLAVVPSFYFVTNSVKGIPLEDTVDQLKREWTTAAGGSLVFWIPAQLLNFALVPQHSKMLYVSSLSFAHKLWLSYLANRHAYHSVPLSDNNFSRFDPPSCRYCLPRHP